MNYLDEVEQVLRTSYLGDGPDVKPQIKEWINEVVGFVRQKLLESYKNGGQAARRGSQKPGSQNKNSKTPE